MKKHILFFFSVGFAFTAITFFFISFYEILEWALDERIEYHKSNPSWEEPLITSGIFFGLSFFINFYLWKNNFFTRNK